MVLVLSALSYSAARLSALSSPAQVLALVGAALLCVNHATAMGDLFTPAPSVEVRSRTRSCECLSCLCSSLTLNIPAQTRIEMIAVAVAAACLTLPAIDARLNSEVSQDL